MPQTLPPGESAIVRHAYPHMMRLDALVWTQFLKDDRYNISEVWYDVKVGAPIEIPPGSTTQEVAIAEGTGCKRIDAIAHMENDLWVIEIKPYANYVPLGQVLAYVDLFREKYATSLFVRPVIVCASQDPDLMRMFTKHKVKIIQVSKEPW